MKSEDYQYLTEYKSE